jgi:hypothetical protein
MKGNFIAEKWGHLYGLPEAHEATGSGIYSGEGLATMQPALSPWSVTSTTR